MLISIKGVLLPFSCSYGPLGCIMYDYWPRKKKTWKTKLAVSLLLVIAFFSGIIMGNFFSGERVVVYNATLPQKTGITMESFDYESNYRSLFSKLSTS